MPTLAQEMTAVKDCNFDQMAVYHFNLPLGNILFMGNATMSGVEGLQNLGLSLVLMTFDQRVTFIVPHLWGQGD